MEHELKTFVRSYIQTALWAEYCPDRDAAFDSSEFSDVTVSVEALKKITKDCKEFMASDIYSLALGESDVERIAHDFWLTRNRHGAGFWDGKYTKKLGEELTEVAHEFGEVTIVVGDNGRFYFE